MICVMIFYSANEINNGDVVSFFCSFFFCCNVFVVIQKEFYENYLVINIDVAVVPFVKVVVYDLFFLILIVVVVVVVIVLLCNTLLTFDRHAFVHIT